MKFDKSVDDIVRQQVLETRPTNIKRFKEVLHTFQEMAALVRSVQAAAGWSGRRAQARAGQRWR